MEGVDEPIGRDVPALCQTRGRIALWVGGEQGLVDVPKEGLLDRQVGFGTDVQGLRGFAGGYVDGVIGSEDSQAGIAPADDQRPGQIDTGSQHRSHQDEDDA